MNNHFCFIDILACMVIVSLIEVIKKKSVVSRNVLFVVEFIIIVITMCMVVSQIVLTKRLKLFLMLGIACYW